MKKLLSILLTLLIVFPLAIGVFAAESAYITDALERVEESELQKLNETAERLKKEYGIGVFLAYVKGHADDVKPEEIVGDEKDYTLLLLGEKGTRIYTGGKADEIFTEQEDRDRLGYVHDEQDEWHMGISRYLEVVEEYLEEAFSEESEPVETIGALDSRQEEAKIDEGGKEPVKGFSPLYLVPIIAAVVIAALAVVLLLKKKA